MQKSIIIIICLLTSTYAHTQPLTGRVTDAITGQAVSYASIGLTKANQGTTASAEGKFTLTHLPHPSGDSLVVSCVGYQTTRIPLEKNRHTYEVGLERNASRLREVVIRHYSRKLTLPWDNSKSKTSIYTRSINSHIQAAKLFDAPATFSRLQSVTVATKTGMFGSGKNSRFRIRIYDYDSVLKNPGNELCDSVIEVSGRGSVKVQLDKFQIILPGNKFFVAVQWLFIEENKEESVVDSGSYYYYRPGIRWLEQTNSEPNTWFQYPDQRWVRWWHNDLAIAATVSY